MNNIARDKIKHLTCGIFNSNSWDRPKTYRVHSDKIESDSSGNYMSQRFSEKGYLFNGIVEDIGLEDVNKIGEILNKIPSKCFQQTLPKPNTPGNKDENVIFMQVDLMDGNSIQFKIDEYDERDSNLDSDIIRFKDYIKETIKLIKEKSR